MRKGNDDLDGNDDDDGVDDDDHHEKVCRGQGPVEAGKRRCHLRGKVIGKKNFGAHRRRCQSRLGVVAEEEEEQPPA